MEPDWIFRIVVLGVVHWVLAGFVLQDLASRRKVVGGRKWPWVVLVVFVMCFGSLLYLLFPPQVLYREEDEQERHDQRKK